MLPSERTKLWPKQSFMDGRIDLHPSAHQPIYVVISARAWPVHNNTCFYRDTTFSLYSVIRSRNPLWHVPQQGSQLKCKTLIRRNCSFGRALLRWDTCTYKYVHGPCVSTEAMLACGWRIPTSALCPAPARPLASASASASPLPIACLYIHTATYARPRPYLLRRAPDSSPQLPTATPPLLRSSSRH